MKKTPVCAHAFPYCHGQTAIYAQKAISGEHQKLETDHDLLMSDVYARTMTQLVFKPVCVGR